MRLLITHPAQFTIRELFQKCTITDNSIRRQSMDEIQRAWEAIQPWLDKADAQMRGETA